MNDRHSRAPWFHTSVLQAHNANMFDTLVQPHNVQSKTVRYCLFENQEGEEVGPLRGFFAIKEWDGVSHKYFIPEANINDLPVRIDEYEELYYKDSSKNKSVVRHPSKMHTFRIRPEPKFGSFRDLVDSIAPFKHSHPDQWTLAKITAITGLVSKTFLGICSPSEFGKSSAYTILDLLTKKSPVFQPRSVPGLLAQITGDGNMVFDEAQDCASEVRQTMENFSLQVGGNTPVYVNGAMKSKGTKSRYDVAWQSITFLYNTIWNYPDADKKFWNNIWANRKAMESRFLCLRFEGRLEERFHKDYDTEALAKENCVHYMAIAKHLEFLREQRQGNAIKRRFVDTTTLPLKGRHRLIRDELALFLDAYCMNQGEYERFIRALDKAIKSYQDMLGGQAPAPFAGFEKEEHPTKVEEEVVGGTSPLDILSEAGMMSVEDFKKKAGVNEEQVEKLKSDGDIFEPRPGWVKVL